MNKAIEQEINSLISRLPPEGRKEIEARLVEQTRELIAEYQNKMAARDGVTLEALDDVKAGRVTDVETSREGRIAFLKSLNASTRGA